jgi:hypothetical protein
MGRGGAGGRDAGRASGPIVATVFTITAAATAAATTTTLAFVVVITMMVITIGGAKGRVACGPASQRAGYDRAHRPPASERGPTGQ